MSIVDIGLLIIAIIGVSGLSYAVATHRQGFVAYPPSHDHEVDLWAERVERLKEEIGYTDEEIHDVSRDEELPHRAKQHMLDTLYREKRSLREELIVGKLRLRAAISRREKLAQRGKA